jgi:hypothetical protein
MPKGMKGFQKGCKRHPGAGRVKGEPTKNELTNIFKDRLKKYGFNFDKELARALKELCHGKPAPQYGELKALLPFTYPKLKEIDPPTAVQREQEAPISTEQLLEAMKSHERKDPALGSSSQSSSPVPVVETGSVAVEDEASSARDLPGLVGVKEED